MPRTINPQAKAEQILKCARRLFVEKGYHRVSIPDIVTASGISTGAIYNLFGSKERLARTLHDRTLNDFHALFLNRLQECHTTYEKLKAFAELIFDLTESDPDMMQYMLFMRHNEFMGERAPICMTEPFCLIREIVKEGIALGEVKQGDYFALAVSYTGAILRPAQLHLECVLPWTLAEMAEEFTNNAWAAIKA